MAAKSFFQSSFASRLAWQTARITFGLALVLGAIFVPTQKAAALPGTYWVNRTDDITPRGTGVTCLTQASTDCTLREAVIKANANPGSTIRFDATRTNGAPIILTRSGNDGTASAGDLDINASTTMIGNGAANTIIQGAADASYSGSIGDKIFGVNQDGYYPSLTVSFSGMTIRYGDNAIPYNDPSWAFTGGGVDIWQTGPGNSATFTDCVISYNRNRYGWGGGFNFDQDLNANGSLTLTNVTFDHNQTTSTAGASQNREGGGLAIHGYQPNVTITNSTFTYNQTTDPDSAGGGIYIGPSYMGTIAIHGTTFDHNTATTGSGGGIAIYYWSSSLYYPVNITIDQDTIVTNNTAGNTGGGIFIQGSYLNNAAQFTNLLVSGNSAAEGGGIYVGLAHATVQYSRIVNNTVTAGTGTGLYKNNSATTVTATRNWWGCSTGPGTAGCDTAVVTGGTLDYDPWLRDELTSPGGTTLVTNQTITSNLTASFLTDSSGAAVAVADLDQIIGLPITWGATSGNASGDAVVSAAGTAIGTYQAASVGSATVYARVDNDNTAPVSSNVLSFTVNKANAITAITSDDPDPSAIGQAVTVAFSVTGAFGNSPTAPTGNVTVSDGTDTCTGTLAAGAGSCTITLSTAGVRTLTATYAGDANFNPSPASAGVAHTVNQAPAITSGNSTTFTVGSAGTFTVTTTGFPTGASMGVSEAGALPSGVTFTDNGNGTATLAGTPAAGTGGAYPITITADNGILPNATQTFTLTVNQAPAITSANTTTLTETLAGSLTVTTSGFPTGASMLISEVGALPTGMTFTDNGNGTATLAGTPAVGTLGNYPITITAANGVLPNATQNFTLIVEPNLRITSANNTTFTVGSAGSFTVTTTGTPTPALLRIGSLPGGVTFVDNGDGTGTLSGTPAAGTAGTYPITFTASNGVAPDDVQNFTLTVNQVPAITSADNTTFTIGGAGTFTVTTTGFPSGAFMSIGEAGALPGGITFTDNGDGTATLAGTSAAGTVGTYPLTITASNGVAPDATQNFTLTVNQATTNTAITSAAPDPSVVGQTVTFNYTVGVVPPGGGIPTGNVTVSNGTDSCTATVAVGSCIITFTAPGTSNFTATYAGNVNYAGSTSAIEPHTVNQASTTTTIASDVPDPSVVGQAVTFSYSVAPVAPGAGTPTGNVTVSNGTQSCTATVAAGSCAIAFTASGTSNFTATYAGDANFAGSNSAVVTHTVNQAGTTTSIISDLPDPSLVGQSVTVDFGVVVAAPGAGTPAGNITVTDGINNCVGTVAAGSCNITLTTTGARILTAAYVGDANFNGSASVGEPHTVSRTPAITSANSTGFIVGVAGSFTVTTSGYPIPGITQGSVLPFGVSFIDNGNGTATLSGTPNAGTGGMYNLTFTASNGVSPNATQSFSLTVGESPVITSPNNVTFVAGNLSSFTITTIGSPTSAITRSGTLPAGITFTDNGNGTATLAGTPAISSVGTYNLIFTAQNGIAPNAVQNFTLTIDGPPAVSRINSSADTGDGQVVENEHTSVAITQLLVVFNKDMNADTPGDLDDALTVTNYSLVQGGSTVIPINGATYNAGTRTATLSVNGSVALPNGAYTLAVLGRIKDTLGVPLGADFVRHFYVDNGHPHHLSIVTAQNNITIVNGATVNVSFSSIDITFDEDLYDPAGNIDPDDVTNAENYLLVTPGANGIFETLSCIVGITGDDVAVPTGPAAYTNHSGSGPFVASLQLNNGTPLPNGLYRLLICGTTSIVDLAGNPLNGDTGPDSQVNFTVLVLSGARNPKTGFTPGAVTVLAAQPADKAYASLGDLWIEIPKLNLQTSITGVPLTTDGWDLTWLNRQVGWLEGTAYPTWEGNTVLTAHGYTADGEAGPFALLKNLSYGETIAIHLGGMKYTYAVRTNLLISPNDTRWLTRHEKLDWITLITCQQYDAQTSSYRYRRVVRAVLVRVEEE